MIPKLGSDVVRYEAALLIGADYRQVKIRSSSFRKCNETRQSSLILYDTTSELNQGGFTEVLYFFHCIDPNARVDLHPSPSNDDIDDVLSSQNLRPSLLRPQILKNRHLLAIVKCVKGEKQGVFYNRQPGPSSVGRKIVIDANSILDTVGFVVDRGLETFVRRDTPFF